MATRVPPNGSTVTVIGVLLATALAASTFAQESTDSGQRRNYAEWLSEKELPARPRQLLAAERSIARDIERWPDSLTGLQATGPHTAGARDVSALEVGFGPLRNVTALPDFKDKDPEASRRLARIEDLAPVEERVIKRPNFLPTHFLNKGAETEDAAGRLALAQSLAGRPPGTGLGTSFLISPAILMTNNYVLKNENECTYVKVQFEYEKNDAGDLGQYAEYRLKPDEVFYTNEELDFTLVAVSSRPLNESSASPAATPPGTRFSYIALDDTVRYAEGQQRLNAVQHPQGAAKQVVLHDNRLKHVTERSLWYTTDTRPGSSGAPILSNTWKLVAIHREAGEKKNGEWITNAGTRVDRIIDGLRRTEEEGELSREVIERIGLE